MCALFRKSFFNLGLFTNLPEEHDVRMEKISSDVEGEKMLISNSRGKKIAAVIQRPDEETNKLAILCPGFLDSKDYAHLRMLADDLVEQGYTSVRFDPTGTWESESDISEYLTSQYLNDIRSVLDFMLQQ